MAVEVYDEPREGLVPATIHSYDQERDVYTVSVGDTVGLEIPAKGVLFEPDFDFDDYDDDYLGGYEG
jgi:hypothetical protein